ncbi:MAG TPA: SusD/RagB family nutrient-binding outer membrane lipoprotein, partial [Flavobacteriaceae bacterium]|nr:SusD/RagB family nutrient-binding outer membrane lipoprotein [Flavobacteriaceae bacterium]
FTFGFNGSWWADSLGYTYDSAYTDAAFDWLNTYINLLSSYMDFVQPGGLLENDRYYAIGLIMKGLYYQMFTDTFGMIPYTEAGNPDIPLPVFDSQATIYQGIINDLDQAMTLIGSATTTDDDPALSLADNDVFFHGDLQKWKKLANTLKLRMALRAQGASGASFADAAIGEAMQGGLLTTDGDNALMTKDTDISQWSNACYGDVWYNFGTGSDWNVGKTLIDYLRDNNDPRLSKYAQPIEGGEVTFDKPTDAGEAALFDKRVDFILAQLDNAGVPYTRVDNADNTVVTVGSGEYYVGQPTRLNSQIYSYVKEELFSKPADIVINPKNQGKQIFPEVVSTAAEGNFLQAEAIVKGFASGDAQAYYQAGITQAMKMWGVSDAEISAFMANEDMALLNGSTDQNLEKISVQRWIATYTDGFEGWAIVRDSGYPAELAQGVSDYDIYAAGDLSGAYPQRMRYGSNVYNTNDANAQAANNAQGPDVQATKLWWAK